MATRNKVCAHGAVTGLWHSSNVAFEQSNVTTLLAGVLCRAGRKKYAGYRQMGYKLQERWVHARRRQIER